LSFSTFGATFLRVLVPVGMASGPISRACRGQEAYLAGLIAAFFGMMEASIQAKGGGALFGALLKWRRGLIGLTAS
jgi:hypothetical protein